MSSHTHALLNKYDLINLCERETRTLQNIRLQEHNRLVSELPPLHQTEACLPVDLDAFFPWQWRKYKIGDQNTRRVRLAESEQNRTVCIYEDCRDATELRHYCAYHQKRTFTAYRCGLIERIHLAQLGHPMDLSPQEYWDYINSTSKRPISLFPGYQQIDYVE